jgi:4-carboxymuconolactone decarboxylase
MYKLPRSYERFKRSHKVIWAAYDRLGEMAHQAGPLSAKSRELAKLAISIGARMEGAVHSATRKALDAGAKPEEIRHVVLLGLTTIGFPSTMACLTWVEDVLKSRRSSKRRAK